MRWIQQDKMARRVDDGKRGGKADESSPETKTLKDIGWSLLTASSRGSKAQLSKATARAAVRAMEMITDAAAQQPDVQSQRAYKAWSASSAELLSLFALALRHSSRSLCPDSPREEIAMYAQLREGLLSELLLLSSAARSLGNAALLSRLGCALLRTGTMQCYATLLSDAALQLQPAARAACADLPDWPNIHAMEEMVEAVLGCSPAGGLTNSRGRAAAVSGALRLAGEAVRLLDLLGACSGGQGERGDVSGIALRHLSRVLGQFQGACAHGIGIEQGNAAGCGEYREFQRACSAARSSGHVSQLYQHATRLLLLATAAARNSGTHQRTHEAASQLAKQLVARTWCFEQGVESFTCSTVTGCGSAVAQLVQLCVALDGGTTYGMAPGLWPLPGGDGAGGAEADDGSLLTKLRLCVMLESWGERPTRHKDQVQMAKDLDERAAVLADNVGLLFRLWSGTENFRIPGSREFAMNPAEAVRMAKRLVEGLASMRHVSASLKLPPCSPSAVLQLCVRLARGLLARGRLSGAGGRTPSSAPAPAAGAAEAAGAVAGAGTGPIAGGGGGGGGGGAGSGIGAGAGAATEEDEAAAAGGSGGGGGGGGAASGGQGVLPEAALLPTAHRVLDMMLFQAAMGTARAVLQPQCDRPARGTAGARRLARLKGWWEVVVEAAQQGVVAMSLVLVTVTEDSRPLRVAVMEREENGASGGSPIRRYCDNLLAMELRVCLGEQRSATPILSAGLAGYYQPT